MSQSSFHYDSTPNRSLFIKSIPLDIRPNDLRAAFSKYGEVKDIYIPRDFYTRKIRGFAYVDTFEKLRDAENAMRNSDRIRLFGKELVVEYAQGNRKTPSEMRIRYSNSSSSNRYNSERSGHRHYYHHHHEPPFSSSSSNRYGYTRYFERSPVYRNNSSSRFRHYSRSRSRRSYRFRSRSRSVSVEHNRRRRSLPMSPLAGTGAAKYEPSSAAAPPPPRSSRRTYYNEHRRSAAITGSGPGNDDNGDRFDIRYGSRDDDELFDYEQN